MKHLLNNMSEEEKNSIREQHTKTLVNEQPSSGSAVTAGQLNEIIGNMGYSKSMMKSKDFAPLNAKLYSDEKGRLVIQFNSKFPEENRTFFLK